MISVIVLAISFTAIVWLKTGTCMKSTGDDECVSDM